MDEKGEEESEGERKRSEGREEDGCGQTQGSGRKWTVDEMSNVLAFTLPELKHFQILH